VKPFATRSASTGTWVTIILAVLILIPSMYGFVGKFVEFIHVYRETADGGFAIAPILNYLLATAGFLMLLFWGIFNGMFHDIERPKDMLLENERRLDRQDGNRPVA
jgi:hypothetical protein